MFRIHNLLLLAVGLSAIPTSIQAQTLGPDRASAVAGLWMTTSEDLAALVHGWPKGPGWITLSIGPDGTAQAIIEGGKRFDLYQGRVALTNRIRVLTVQDLDGKKYSFGLLSHGPNALGLATPGVSPRLADLDGNGDGFVSLEEAAKSPLAGSFFGLDANRDGRLDAGEFETHLIKNPPKETHIRFQRVARRFSDLDRDRDGLLSGEELENTRFVGKRFETDLNRDGKIDPPEFVAFWAKYPPMK